MRTTLNLIYLLAKLNNNILRSEVILTKISNIPRALRLHITHFMTQSIRNSKPDQNEFLKVTRGSWIFLFSIRQIFRFFRIVVELLQLCSKKILWTTYLENNNKINPHWHTIRLGYIRQVRSKYFDLSNNFRVASLITNPLKCNQEICSG